MSSRPEPARPRAQTAKSERSHKSRLSETHDEKAARILTTKADPTLAMNEAQPSTIALEQSTLGSLAAQVRKDDSGDASERDLSNPTRYRWERPLDTIRNFEASIDRRHKQNSQIPDNASVFDGGMASRRSSVYGGGYGGGQRFNPRGSNEGFFGYGEPGNSSQRQSYYGNDYGASPHAPPTRNRYSSYRGQSESAVYGVYRGGPGGHGGPGPNMPGRQYSQNYGHPNSNGHQFDASSGESHQWNTHTDPSSMNSSVDRLSPTGPPAPPVKNEPYQPRETYGLNDFGADPQLTYAQQQNMQRQNGGGPPPPPPAHAGANGANGHANGYANGNTNGNTNGNSNGNGVPPRVPIKFSSNGPAPTQEEVFPNEKEKKRRSFFSLRKSK